MEHTLTAGNKVSANLKTIFLLVVICVELACAQPTQNIRTSARRTDITPVMNVTDLRQGETNPMHIDELKIDIQVVGQLAVTTMEMSYYNSNSRAMEGEFNFPLADGMNVSRFALDINGKMREGVVVEKEQGRKTFEAIARRQVDPGLLEKTAGNNFKARVFPLPANGYRRIIIAYEQELPDKGKGYLYQLPLNIKDRVEKFSLHAEVIRQEVLPDTTENEFVDIEFKKWNEAYVTDIKKENYTPDQQLSFIIPAQKEMNIYTGQFKTGSDSSWFYLCFNPKKEERSRVQPKKIAILWDNSNSGKDRNREKELSVLEGYINKIGDLEVELIPFHIRPGKSQSFKIRNGNWDALRKAIAELTYDGGTSFGNINFSNYPCNEILLFSDGLSNFGNSAPALPKVPVMAINSGGIANHSFLKNIAYKTAGIYINLAQLSTAEAVNMLSVSNYQFISAEVKQGNITEIYPSGATQFSGSFSMAGILKGSSATITLHFGFGSETTHTETIKISADKPLNSGMLKRIWAGKKLAYLSMNEEENKDEITRLGKTYGIVTSNTSLIVLDNLEDYLRYGIVPPEEMQHEYYAKLKENEKFKAEKTNDHLEAVATLFDERLKWWNTSYPIKGTKRNKGETADTIVYEGLESDTAAAVEMITVEENASAPAAVNMELEEVSDVEAPAPPAILMDVSEEKSKAPQHEASIQLNAWDPQSPYLKSLNNSPAGQEYSTYLKLKEEYGTIPFFYVDASDFFLKIGQKEIALLILSNLAELKLESPQLLRILGKKLQLMNEPDYAVMVFEKILKLRGEEAQSYRDLGLIYEASGKYQQAINILYEAVKQPWDGRFPGIELIMLEEINNIIAQHKTAVDYSFMDKRLIKNMPLDIRVVLTWDTDNCDMDLWVTDPEGEKCLYSNKLTYTGGLMSNDFTQGYGPEEFLIRKALTGDYTVEVNYFGTQSQDMLAPVTLYLTFYTNYGKPDQKKQETSLRLDVAKDVVMVGKFGFKKK